MKNLLTDFDYSKLSPRALMDISHCIYIVQNIDPLIITYQRKKKPSKRALIKKDSTHEKARGSQKD